jgi:hypothetical protein
MGLLEILENALINRPKKEQVNLKEIFCKRRDDNYIKRFNTSVVGARYRNVDGSQRQDAIAKLKPGERLRLIWDAGPNGRKNKINLLRGGRSQQLNISHCVGRLSDKVSADVIRWLTQENIVTTARVVKVSGGTRKRPKLTCVVELTTYPGPKKK